MRIPARLRSDDPPDLSFAGPQAGLNASGRLCYRMPSGGHIHVHSVLAAEREKIDFSSSQGELCIVFGVGQGFVLKSSLKQFKHLILIDPDPGFCSVGLSLVKDQFETLLVLGPESPISEWKQAQSLCSRYRAGLASFTTPIYREICKEWFQRVSDFLFLPLALPKSEPRLALLYGEHFLLRELADAMANLGESICWDWQKRTQSKSWILDFQVWLDRHRPTALLCVNMKGLDSDGQILAELRRRGIRLCVWFVDDPRPILAAYPDLDKSIVTVLLWEKAYRKILHGFDHIFDLPLAAEKSRFEKGKVNPNSRLSFVASPMSGRFLAQLQQKVALNITPAQLQKWSLQWHDQKDLQQLEFLLSQGLSLPAKQQIWLNSLVIHHVSGLKRQAIVQECLDLDLHVYGDPGDWQRIFPTFSHSFYESVHYPDGVDQIYAGSFLQLNSTSAQMPTAVNQRVFDVPAMGSLVFNDTQADLDEFFERGSQIIYRDLCELREFVDFYRHHPESGRALVQSQRLQIQNRHFYEHRIQTIVGILGGLGR